VYNKTGGLYSNNVTSQKLVSSATGEISIINNTIYSMADSMFEIKFPNNDIKIMLRRKTA
jgi:hypothetical protein